MSCKCQHLKRHVNTHTPTLSCSLSGHYLLFLSYLGDQLVCSLRCFTSFSLSWEITLQLNGIYFYALSLPQLLHKPASVLQLMSWADKKTKQVDSAYLRISFSSLSLCLDAAYWQRLSSSRGAPLSTPLIVLHLLIDSMVSRLPPQPTPL